MEEKTIPKKRYKHNSYSKKLQIKIKENNNSFNFTLPKDSDELERWGEELSHCVSSYSYLIENFELNATIIGVFKNNILRYCIEAQENKIYQIKGKYNSHPIPEDIPYLKMFTSSKNLEVVRF